MSESQPTEKNLPPPGGCHPIVSPWQQIDICCLQLPVRRLKRNLQSRHPLKYACHFFGRYPPYAISALLSIPLPFAPIHRPQALVACPKISLLCDRIGVTRYLPKSFVWKQSFRMLSDISFVISGFAGLGWLVYNSPIVYILPTI